MLNEGTGSPTIKLVPILATLLKAELQASASAGPGEHPTAYRENRPQGRAEQQHWLTERGGGTKMPATAEKVESELIFSNSPLGLYHLNSAESRIYPLLVHDFYLD